MSPADIWDATVRELVRELVVALARREDEDCRDLAQAWTFVALSRHDKSRPVGPRRGAARRRGDPAPNARATNDRPPDALERLGRPFGNMPDPSRGVMANDSVIGLLRVLLTANTAEFGSAMKTATGDVQTFAREATKAGGEGSKGSAAGLSGMVESLGSMKGLLIGGGIIGGIVARGKGFVDAAGQVNDLSDAWGASTTAVQRWKDAAEQTGASVDDVAVAMGKLSKASRREPQARSRRSRKSDCRSIRSATWTRRRCSRRRRRRGRENSGPDATRRGRDGVVRQRRNENSSPRSRKDSRNSGIQAEATGNVMSEDVVRRATTWATRLCPSGPERSSSRRSSRPWSRPRPGGGTRVRRRRRQQVDHGGRRPLEVGVRSDAPRRGGRLGGNRG